MKERAVDREFMTLVDMMNNLNEAAAPLLEIMDNLRGNGDIRKARSRHLQRRQTAAAEALRSALDEVSRTITARMAEVTREMQKP